VVAPAAAESYQGGLEPWAGRSTEKPTAELGRPNRIHSTFQVPGHSSCLGKERGKSGRQHLTGMEGKLRKKKKEEKKCGMRPAALKG
jgi:hypothetical protein